MKKVDIVKVLQVAVKVADYVAKAAIAALTALGVTGNINFPL